MLLLSGASCCGCCAAVAGDANVPVTANIGDADSIFAIVVYRPTSLLQSAAHMVWPSPITTSELPCTRKKF